MDFEYDSHKSAINLEIHGITLEDAKVLWRVPNVQLKARALDEPRFMIIGKVGGKFYSCIYTLRAGNIRLISARRSRKSEEAIYNDYFQK